MHFTCPNLADHTITITLRHPILPFETSNRNLVAPITVRNFSNNKDLIGLLLFGSIWLCTINPYSNEIGK